MALWAMFVGIRFIRSPAIGFKAVQFEQGLATLGVLALGYSAFYLGLGQTDLASLQRRLSRRRVR